MCCVKRARHAAISAPMPSAPAAMAATVAKAAAVSACEAVGGAACEAVGGATPATTAVPGTAPLEKAAAA